MDDGSTSVLMKHMYLHLMDGRTTVAQALRLAMLHLLRRPVDEPSDNGVWRRPVFWAGFRGGCYHAPALHRPFGTSPAPGDVPGLGIRPSPSLSLPRTFDRTLALSRPLFYLSLCACVRVCVCVCVFC